jgi:hypothetical protein
MTSFIPFISAFSFQKIEQIAYPRLLASQQIKIIFRMDQVGANQHAIKENMVIFLNLYGLYVTF